MNAFDPYLFYILVFSPIAASIFITLIPAADTGSKLAISRFFSTIIIIVFFKTFWSYLNGTISPEVKFLLHVLNLNIQINLYLDKYNICLYGTAACALFVNMLSYVINDTKTNIHQVAPFVFTFFLFISFGQSDLRIALPILSIANFLLYFLIGSGEKIRRGSTIFQMGIFLFFCDALALIMLQIPFSITLKNLILLLPGLARILLPMLAPFARRLILNIDDTEGPFLITFLQLSGFYILVLAKNAMPISIELIIFISIVAVIGALYIMLAAINDLNPRLLPYYFLIFYSSVSVVVLLISQHIDLYHFFLSLFITNIACFLCASRFTLYESQPNTIIHPKLKSSWFIILALFIGLPGLGVGTSLWPAIFKFSSLGFFKDNQWINYWRSISLAWLIGLLLPSAVMILSLKKQAHHENLLSMNKDKKHSMLIASLFVALLSWLIPMVLLYKSNKGL